MKIYIVDKVKGLTEKEIRQLLKPFGHLNPHNKMKILEVGFIISKHLVNRISSNIGIENTPEKGSIFWLEIPLYT